MKNIAFYLILSVMVFSCAGMVEAQSSSENAEVSEQQERSITMNINNRLYIKVQREADSTWTGVIELYDFRQDGSKFLTSKWIPVQDSTWQDLPQMINYLDLFNHPDQSEIPNHPGNEFTNNSKGYHFIILKDGEERTLTYVDPEKDLNSYWQAVPIITFASFVGDDLSWQQVEVQEN